MLHRHVYLLNAVRPRNSDGSVPFMELVVKFRPVTTPDESQSMPNQLELGPHTGSLVVQASCSIHISPAMVVE